MLPKTAYERYEVWSPTTGRFRSGEKQAKPYNLLCRLSNFDAWSDVNRTSYGGLAVDVRATFEPYAQYAGDSDLYNKVNNLAYKRLVGQLGDSASLGATLTAERRETLGMVTNLVLRGISAARNVRKLRLADAARDLGIPYREHVVKKRHRVRLPNGKKRTIITRETQFDLPNGRRATKSLASGWLLYSYGIAPLMGDIQTSMDILNSDFPWHRVKGGARMKSKRTNSGRKPWGAPYMDSWELEYSAMQGVNVRVSNPNLWLAGKLGLVNPAQWALEAIPFSFVIDWFSNLSDVVNSMSDFTGYETDRACVNSVEIRRQAGYYYSDWNWQANWTQRWSKRSLGLSYPTLVFAYERFQWQRAANAISLLVGFLPNKKQP